MKHLLLCVFCTLLVQSVFAHRGGHHTSDHEQTARIWRYQDGRLAAVGDLLTVKGQDILIEGEYKVTTLPLADLSKADQEYAVSKLLEIRLLNSDRNTQSPLAGVQATKSDFQLWYLAGAALLLVVIALCVTKWQKYRLASGLFVLFGAITVSLSACDSSTIDPGDQTSFTNDPSYMQTSFGLYPKSIIGTDSDDTYFYVETNSIPNHQMMVGITAWIAQVPVPHVYEGNNAYAIPLNPTFADEEVTIEDDLRRGPIALASNGIAVFNPVNASGLISYDIGELDEYGGHSGRGDDYHYHIAPLHLESTSGNYPIAYGLDGFPVYGSQEPDGASMESLDEYHGHVYQDQYHYHGTDTYPFLIGKMRGKVTLSGTSPETQIDPQPQNTPVRGDPRGIGDYRPGDANFEITGFEARQEGVGYILTYEHNGATGSVEYYWDENDFFTYIFTDPDGTVETQTFQRN